MSVSPHLGGDRLLAIFDGEAEASELAHVAGCLECAERAERWRAASALAASPPPQPPAEVVEAALSVAVEAGVGAAREARESATRAGSPGSPSRRREWSLGAWSAAAMAFLVLAIGVAVAAMAGHHQPVASRSSAGSHYSTGGPRSAGDTSGRSSAAAGASSNGVAAGPPAAAPAYSGGAGFAPSRLGLGSFSDTAALVAALRRALSEPVTAPTGSHAQHASGSLAPATAGCQSRAGSIAGASGPAQATLLAPLTWKGYPAWVFVFPTGTTHVAVVASTVTCAILARVRF